MSYGPFSRELNMALAGPQRGMKIANFRENRGLEVGQTSGSVQQATGQEAGPTRQQPFSGEDIGFSRAENGLNDWGFSPCDWEILRG